LVAVFLTPFFAGMLGNEVKCGAGQFDWKVMGVKRQKMTARKTDHRRFKYAWGKTPVRVIGFHTKNRFKIIESKSSDRERGPGPVQNLPHWIWIQSWVGRDQNAVNISEAFRFLIASGGRSSRTSDWWDSQSHLPRRWSQWWECREVNTTKALFEMDGRTLERKRRRHCYFSLSKMTNSSSSSGKGVWVLAYLWIAIIESFLHKVKQSKSSHIDTIVDSDSDSRHVKMKLECFSFWTI
jgi:hypothetical protein